MLLQQICINLVKNVNKFGRNWRISVIKNVPVELMIVLLYYKCVGKIATPKLDVTIVVLQDIMCTIDCELDFGDCALIYLTNNRWISQKK